MTGLTDEEMDRAFRFLPPDRKAHYEDEPWWDWVSIEYHLSQSCALGTHAICVGPTPWGYRCPRMPLGYCECVCHEGFT